MLRKLEAEIGLSLSGETECCGVTVNQCHLLLETEYRGKASLGALAEALDLDKSTLSRTADALVIDGLLERADDPENRRKVTINLTEKGSAKASEVNRLCDAFYAQVLSRIPAEKRDEVMEAVVLLADAMRLSRKGDDTCC